MTTKSDMELEYEFFCSIAELVKNPHLDTEKPTAEQLVVCGCSKEYRVVVNGNTPIPDTEMKDVFCPRCGAPAKNFSSVSGHSGGVFNSTIGYIK